MLGQVQTTQAGENVQKEIEEAMDVGKINIPRQSQHGCHEATVTLPDFDHDLEKPFCRYGVAYLTSRSQQNPPVFFLSCEKLQLLGI